MFEQFEELSKHLVGNWYVLGEPLLYFLTVAAVLFVLISRKINPFSISQRKNTRNRVRFARYIAFSIVQSSIVLFAIGEFTSQEYVYFSLLMASFIIVPVSIAYCVTWYKIRKSSRQGLVSENRISVESSEPSNA